ncbi:hypothetical protein SAMN06265182_1693 [Persephonella hydrogeniphila]|uniref:Uncharacterized protein n=1 Tax=Persephonella hydrogeniphila TaxID=198703 RepID=A0A285NLZ2_9AQUI|nr:hypothetical protein [Persephonella hydrogeniphila]SNZ09977.1 hypothetical protein SAMN06265182_1693 [Persephonella hydrogeniphila]
MGKAYNPEDYLCQVCAYKSCLHKNKGRDIFRKKILEISKKRENSSDLKEEVFNFCKTADSSESE